MRFIVVVFFEIQGESIEYIIVVNFQERKLQCDMDGFKGFFLYLLILQFLYEVLRFVFIGFEFDLVLEIEVV